MSAAEQESEIKTGGILGEIPEIQERQQDSKGGAPVSIALVEDTEDDSSHDEDGVVEEEDGYSSAGEEGNGDDNDKETSMPLLKYTRLFGSLPRQQRQEGTSPPLSVPCTCSVMGKVLLTSETTATSESASGERPDVPIDLWQQLPIHIMAAGFQDGQVWLTDACSATAIAGPEQLRVSEGRQKEPIVAVSLDASGTILAAMDAAGTCVIWELKYTVQMRSPAAATSSSSLAAGGQGNVFTSFMSALTGVSADADADNTNNNNTTNNPLSQEESSVLVPTLCLASVQASRIPYPKSFGVPTCMVIDPSYKKKREKSIMVGFSDGRLVLTKRGFVFQRRSDAVVYTAVANDDKTFAGIEAIAWRGSIVAWGDASGVRLLDADTLTRIAHVDRPTGARPSLYPTVSAFRPQLCFETSNKLLVAWGDCLMRLAVRESTVSTVSGGTTTSASEISAAGGSNGPTVVRRRTVECTMAWELDCVACGVAPLDEDHVIVLGLVPPLEEEDGGDGVPAHDGHNQNDVELQVVSRSDGTVIYSDLLPLLRPPIQSSNKRNSNIPEESLSNYALVSSFAMPRMDNAGEVLEEIVDDDDNFDPLQVSIFSAPESKKTFRDSHLRWSLKDAAYEDVEDGEDTRPDLTSDADSVDSDDYDFIFRHPSTFTESNTSKASIPPLMLISTGVDVVLATIRDVDDAVSYALSSKKAGLALRRALRHLRRLRRYDISDLVNEYFRTLLRLPENENDAGTDAPAEDGVRGEHPERPHLSLRRMKLAAEAMPILLGGNIDLWRLWVSELEKIPGALFVVRSFLPVRGECNAGPSEGPPKCALSIFIYL
jgi:hypothetical protein